MIVTALTEGWRAQRRHPWRFAANVLALGASFALSATLFAIIDALVLRPLPFRESKALYFGPADRRVPGALDRPLSLAEIHALSELAIVESAGGFSVRLFDPHLEALDQVVSAGVSGQFFETLGVSPFLPGGDALWQHSDPEIPVVVLREDLARRLTGSSRIAAGTLVTIAGRQMRIAGLGPRDFDFPRGANVWVHRNRQTPVRSFRAVLRLRAPASSLRLGDGVPPMLLQPLASFDRTPRSWSPALIAMMAFAGVIAVFVHQGAAWLSSMMSRAQVRDIRAALGATDRQLAAEALAEMGFVVVAAVLVALLLVPSAVAAALHLLPASLLAGKAVRVDHRLFAFLALVATAGMLALAASATLLGRRLSGAQLGSRLYQRAPSSRMGSGPHIVMVCLQMSLMVASGYLSIVAVRSYVLTAQQSLGFDPDKLFSIRLPAVPAQASAPQRLAVWERVASLNGVVAVAAGPLPQGGGRIPVSVTVEAAMSAGDLEASPRNADEQWVDDAWLVTVGVTIVEGRHFDPREDVPGEVVILTASLARAIGDGRPLVGRTVWVRGTPKTVVGITADVLGYGPEAGPAPFVYLLSRGTGDLVVRTSVPPSQLVRAVQGIIEEAFGQGPPPAISLASERYAELTKSQRAHALLLGVVALFNVLFGAASLLRSASAFAGARLKEAAVRIAIGAPQAHAIVYVVRRLGYAIGGGVAAGLLGGVLLAGAGSALWYGIHPLDGLSIAMVVLMAVATLMIVAVKTTRSILSANLMRLLSEQ